MYPPAFNLIFVPFGTFPPSSTYKNKVLYTSRVNFLAFWIIDSSIAIPSLFSNVSCLSLIIDSLLFFWSFCSGFSSWDSWCDRLLREISSLLIIFLSSSGVDISFPMTTLLLFASSFINSVTLSFGNTSSFLGWLSLIKELSRTLGTEFISC